ncbi:MAG TPA: hypothetical protein VGI90_06015 [Steroidobacteraceae bacterium]
MLQLLFVQRTVDRPKTDMRKAHRTAPVDYKPGGHSLHLVLLCKLALRIKFNAKRRLEFRQKPLRILAFNIDINREDDQAPRAIGVLHLLHPRKRLTARGAPRRPEIQIYDATSKIIKVNGTVGGHGCHRGEKSRRPHEIDQAAPALGRE